MACPLKGQDFKEITLEVGSVSIEQSIEELQNKKVIISDWAAQITDSIPRPVNKETVTFVMGSLSEFFNVQYELKAGKFLDQTFLNEFVFESNGGKYKLELCKPGDAYFIRGVYLADQPPGEIIKVGMQPVLDKTKRRYPIILNLRNSLRGRCIMASGAAFETSYSAETLLIYRKTKL